MSALVSYGVGSSDESDTSDNEDTTVPSVASDPRSVMTQMKEEAGPTTRPQPSEQVSHNQQKTSLFASLPKPKSSSEVSNVEKNVLPSSESQENNQSDRREPQKKKSLFASLPSPKTASVSSSNKSVTSKPSSVSTSAISGNTLTKGLLNLPPPKKKLHPVKIGLPSLPDPDSDDDEPEVKKPKSTKGAGLFSVLPKPKSAVRKEANRILIPYSLTKKPTQPPKPAAIPSRPKPSPTESKTKTLVEGQKSTGVTQLISGYNSDDDDDDDDGDESGNFFSVKEEPRTERTDVPVSKTMKSSDPSSSANNSAGEVGESTEGLNSGAQSGVEKLQSDTGEFRTSNDTISSVKPVDLPGQDQPLVFSTSASNVSSGHLPYGAVQQPSYAQSSYDTNYAYEGSGEVDYRVYEQTGEGTAGASGVQYYNQPYQEGCELEQVSVPSSDGVQDFYGDERFAKMVGKKNRGKEAVQFIDINADDQIGPNAGLQVSMKAMTEEKEYRGKLKKEQLPTSQQKRKHQITYLARQAKERELELKNQWADNRMTRKQTQAKYGF